MILVDDFEEKEIVISDKDVYLKRNIKCGFYSAYSKYTDCYLGELPAENARDFITRIGLRGLE